MRIEPLWAYPVYDLAFTYLLMGDFDNALKYYRETDAIEPDGFFTTKTAIYTLEGEKAGLFPEGLYTFYMQIEWTEEPEKKYSIAKQIVDNVPLFAPARQILKNVCTLLNKGLPEIRIAKPREFYF